MSVYLSLSLTHSFSVPILLCLCVCFVSNLTPVHLSLFLSFSLSLSLSLTPRHYDLVLRPMAIQVCLAAAKRKRERTDRFFSFCCSLSLKKAHTYTRAHSVCKPSRAINRKRKIEEKENGSILFVVTVRTSCLMHYTAEA